MPTPASPLLFVFLAAQRFGCFRNEVAVVEKRVSVCYLSYLPESPALQFGTISLVDESSGNKTHEFLHNFTATFLVKEPGSYHFEVSTAQGVVSSESFNVTVEGMCSMLLISFLPVL